MRSAKAFAKINLSLVVGPRRSDGKHEVVTVLQAIDLFDTVSLESSTGGAVVVEGFEDTIVTRALGALAEAASVPPGWRVRIEKRIPVAAGLGGGSADAAAALRLANELIPEPLAPRALHEVAASIGADVPFFLGAGTKLATGDGSEVTAVTIPLNLWVVLVLPAGERKTSTAAVYDQFSRTAGAEGFEERRTALLAALSGVRKAVDLARLPANDLASSDLAPELTAAGAFRADVAGAGPTVYGLFEHRATAERAVHELRARGRTWLARPVNGP